MFLTRRSVCCAAGGPLSGKRLSSLAFEQAQQDDLNNNVFRLPCVILVDPFDQSNVGAVARSMLNFSFHDLRIVHTGILPPSPLSSSSPPTSASFSSCDHLSLESKRLAVGAVAILQKARVYKSLQDAISDLQLVYSSTSKQRNNNSVIFSPFACAAQLHQALALQNDSTDSIINNNNNSHSPQSSPSSSSSSKSGIVFGRERVGLTNQELELCGNSIIAIPTYENFPVMNLAQSVNIICYEFYLRRIKLKLEMALNESLIRGSGEETKGGNGRAVQVEQTLNQYQYQYKANDQRASMLEIDSYCRRLQQQQQQQRRVESCPNISSVSSAHAEKTTENMVGKVRALLCRGGVSSSELRMLHGLLTAEPMIRQRE